ncbi:hypothetical protein ACFPGO_04105 [Arcanobacterium canis]|uniref:ABC3 transporter permease C-terminal domain-containing protein n=1 Tax=Arcanobacterium canis TaxID=999183 RepID=A0ABY8G2F3_9ACTO|nr:hypothetical protein [Arcanobacterium canis]WFM84014.1 hypothetical protein P7079_03305 [Arcanobacterium canis]
MRTLSLASMLAKARLATRTGNALLDVFAVVAFSVSSWLTLTTLGGVWMFHSNQQAISSMFATQFGQAGQFQDNGRTYFALSVLALALLTIPLLSLGAAAARLGANGRERRLASLRLVGMSARQVVGMSIIESLIHASLGFLIGMAIYVASLPAWTALSFAMVQITVAKMMLPWWGILATFGLISAISIISTMAGLAKVSISPLGVARRVTPGAVRMWRMGTFAIALVVVLYFSGNRDHGQDMEFTQIMTFAALLGILFGAVALVGPLFIQITMRPLLGIGKPAWLLGIRRVVSDARGAWRNISSVALMGLVASLTLTLVSFNIERVSGSVETGSMVKQIASDISQGVVIAFAFAVILGAISTLIHQASDIFDRADEARSLVQIGTPLRVLIRARIIQVMAPMTPLMTILVAIGFLPALSSGTTFKSGNMSMLLVMVGIGIVLTLVSVLVMIPIQHQLVRDHVRKND